MKPLIGITVNYITNDKPGIEAGIGGNGQFWQMLADDYVKAVYTAGGLPVLLPVLPLEEQNVDGLESLDWLDGILFSGGNDINPQLYGEKMTEEVGNIEPERDYHEIHLIRQALESEIPVLGICRGTQLINVAAGGTLRQDIDTEKNGSHFCKKQFMRTPVHMLTAKPGTLIQKIGGERFAVNSFHHQCVELCGTGIEVSAFDDSGIPECIEMPGRKGFMLGTQWHPEGMALTDEANKRVFEAFILAAEERKNKK